MFFGYDLRVPTPAFGTAVHGFRKLSPSLKESKLILCERCCLYLHLWANLGILRVCFVCFCWWPKACMLVGLDILNAASHATSPETGEGKIKKTSPTVPKEHTVDKGVVTIAPVLASRCDPFMYSSTCCVFLNIFMGFWLKIIDPTKWYKMHDCNWLFHISWPKMRSLCPNPQFLAMAISQKLPKIFSRRPSHDVALPRRRCEIPAWVLSQPARWQCPPKILSLDDSILAASKLRWQVRHLNHRFWDFVLNIPYLWEKYKLTCLGPFFRFPYQAGRPTADLTRIKSLEGLDKVWRDSGEAVPRKNGIQCPKLWGVTQEMRKYRQVDGPILFELQNSCHADTVDVRIILLSVGDAQKRRKSRLKLPLN